jgi:hypothetical protein
MGDPKGKPVIGNQICERIFEVDSQCSTAGLTAIAFSFAGSLLPVLDSLQPSAWARLRHAARMLSRQFLFEYSVLIDRKWEGATFRADDLSDYELSDRFNRKEKR